MNMLLSSDEIAKSLKTNRLPSYGME